MPAALLPDIPSGSDVFIDANIFVYGLTGQSAQCQQLLERCGRQEVIGVCLFEVVNEATHRFMLAEALSRRLISAGRSAELRKNHHVIPRLSEYWQRTQRILALNLLLAASDESVVRASQVERQTASLLTNDSMIVSCMRAYGLTLLATNDRDFERVVNIKVFRPGDLP